MSQDEEDRGYYSARAEQETDAGNRATDPVTAAIHFELAHRYSLLADGIPTLIPQRRVARR